MKILRSLLSIGLVLLMAVSVVACHPKNETAITVGNVKITSSLYLTCLLNAHSEAMGLVDETLTENDVITQESDYFDKTIEGVNFKQWVKDTALQTALEFAYVDKLNKEGAFKFSDESKAEAESTAALYWDQYGLSALYEENGINENTYKQSVIYSYMTDEYFLSLYDKGGSKAVNDKTVREAIINNFESVRKIEGAVSSDMTETEIESLKKQFEGYYEDLKNGKITFEELYKKHNNLSDEQIKSMLTKEEGKEYPNDLYSTVIGGSKTQSKDENFVAIKAMKEGEVKLFELSNGGYNLIVRKNIAEEDYYIKNLRSSALHLLKDEEFETYLKEQTKTLNASVNNYAINNFKVEKIITANSFQQQ